MSRKPRKKNKQYDPGSLSPTSKFPNVCTQTERLRERCKRRLKIVKKVNKLIIIIINYGLIAWFKRNRIMNMRFVHLHT